MKKHIYSICLCLMFANCNTNETPKIVHNDTQKTTTLNKDHSIIEAADLPIQLDSTDYLLHPIGEFLINRRKTKRFLSSDDYVSDNFTISSSHSNGIRGNLSNILFQHKDSEELVPLTDQVIKINSLTFLSHTYKNIGKQYLIYNIIDADSNKDRHLDDFDISTLYLSHIDGSNVIKLTPNNHELLNWRMIHSLNRIYFRSLEDTDKNGEFNKKDKIHYFYVNLDSDTIKVIPYYPVNL